jgi:CcmD family protein
MIIAILASGFGPVHVRPGDALPYLALAYSVFFVAVFAYIIALSRRQARVQRDLAVLQQVIDDERMGPNAR